MAVFYEFINKMGAVCSSMNGKASTFCLPKKIQCRETDDDGFLQDCDKKYCDIKCDFETDGSIPFVRGDKIMFQLQFRDKVNSDPKNPTLGWGDWVYFELYNAETGNIITQSLGHAAITRYFVCHNGVNSYQQIEIDTDAIGIPCSWSIKFIAYDGSGEEAIEIDSRCSQTFKEVDECMETMQITGHYTNFDCLGNYYGTPDCEDGQQFGATVFKYVNTTRIEGRVIKGVPEIETIDEKDFLVENYSLTTKYGSNKNGTFLSFYMISWYINLFNAKSITIDNKSQIISNFAVEYDRTEPNSAVVDYAWKVKCKECNT